MDPIRDIQYQSLPNTHSEIEHEYGENVHILSSPFMMTLLAKVCAKETGQPEANRIFSELYTSLVNVVVDAEFPRAQAVLPTRMIDSTERGVYAGEILDLETQVAVAAVARAGIVPSQIVFDRLNMLLNANGVRLDFFLVSRTTDDDHKVTGAAVSSSKIGGPLENRILLLPDPMGATGSSLLQTLDVYKESGTQEPIKKIAMHMIVTPEYLKNLREKAPDVIVYTLRLDRGLSDPEVLATKPGTLWDRERGLNDVHYIVPGGGGIGEVMTNSWV